MTIEPIVRRVHGLALQTYRRMPRLLRRWIVRTLAPSYTVGSICLIERPDGHVLLVRQTYRTRWGLPGGLLNRGEDPEDGARREILEEVGMAIELVGPPAVVVAPDPQRVDVIFLARPLTLAEVGEARPTSPEIVEVGWFAPDDLPELQPETAEALVTLARRRTVASIVD